MQTCYRCHTPLTMLENDSTADRLFFHCPSCKSDYSKSPAGSLHDRWGMPITLPLYLVIYSEYPSEKVEQAILEFSNKPTEFRQTLIAHIQDELDKPKQKVSEIHQYQYPDEDRLREFLREFMHGLDNQG